MRFVSGWRGLDMRCEPLQDLLDCIIDHRGKTPKKLGGDFSPSGVPVLSAKNIKSGRIEGELRHVTRQMYEKWMPVPLKSGDVLLTSEAPLGELHWLGEDSEYVLGQRLFGLRPNEAKLHSGFLYYYLLTEPGQSQLHGRASGSTVQGIRQSELMRISVPLPPVDIQREIADTLRAIDDKIANNRALAADLEAMARAIFKSWFVDFDPVKAKMEGRAPTGMDADTAALFPDELVESELGLIPKEWEAGTLANHAELNPESWSARNHPDMIQYADLSGTDRGQIVETKVFAWADAPSRARWVLKTGDSIVGTVRPGNRAYSYVGFDGLTGSTGFAVLRPRVPSLRSFVYLAATADEAIDRLTNLADGAAYPAVRPDVVLATPVVASPIPIAEQFAKVTGPLLDMIVATQTENVELAELRDTLLPRLISGKIRLPESSDQPLAVEG